MIDLYRAVILEHGHRPRGRRLPEGAVIGRARNPACGDAITIGRAGDALGFEGRGCLVAIASASVLVETLSGLGADRALATKACFDAILRGEEVEADPALLAFAAVAKVPVRRACAALAWEALAGALRGGEGDRAW
jgi:nitrogen fixation NifU-like protein